MNLGPSLLARHVLFLIGIGLHGLAIAAGLQPVTVQLNWKHQFEFAAFYAAEEQGYYRDAGLTVILREGGPGVDSVGEVLAGRADFGVGNSSLVIERYKGKRVVALAALMQHSAIALLARRDQGVETINDLQGRQIACAAHSCDEIQAYLLNSGLRKNDVRFVPHHSWDLEALDKGELGASEVFLSNEPYWIQGREHEYVVFTPRSAGIDLFGNVLFTTDAMSDRQPHTLRRFREATLRGMVYALGHQEQMVDLILARYNSQKKSRDHLLYEARHLYELIRPDLIEPGYMSPGRWKHVVSVYANLGMMPADFQLEGFIYDDAPGQLPKWLKLVVMAMGLGLLIALIVAHQLRRINRRLSQEISDRINAENALKESQEKFRTLVDHANTLLSHELRTPLSVIKVHLDILELKRTPDHPDHHNFSVMRQAVLRLQDLFGEKLRSMFSSPSLASERQHIDLVETLRLIVAEFNALCDQQDIRLDCPQGTRMEAIVSHAMLKTALFNILDNAVKYSQEDNRIDIALSHQDNCGVIRVENRCAFSPPKDIPALFEKATRGQNETVPGSGVGLYLVRLISEAHGWRTLARIVDGDVFVMQLTIPLVPDKHE